MNISKRAVSLILAVVLAVSCLSICVFAESEIKSGIAFVDASALNMRSGPSTGYSVVDIAYRDEVVVVISQSGDWYKVIYNLQEGYMHRDYLDISSVENAELGYGKINSYCVNLRSGPSTSYEVVAQAYEGAKAYIIGMNDGWYKVIYDGAYAYVRSDLLDLTQYPYENRESSNEPKYFIKGEPISDAQEPEENEKAEEAPDAGETQPAEPQPEEPKPTLSGTATVDASALYLREQPTTSSRALGMAYRDETVALLDQTGEWYHVSYDGTKGYMFGEYLIINGPSSAGQELVECAKQYLGVPYVWGGASPSGFDCSGFVQYVARSCGYSIGRTVTQQWEYGTQVTRDTLQPGDLIFFSNTYESGLSHIGIYVGDGQFIHSPSSGDVVKISDLDSSYYSSHYYGARRLG